MSGNDGCQATETAVNRLSWDLQFHRVESVRQLA